MANSISATEGYYQAQLAISLSFLSRLKVQMITVAMNVKAEALSTAQHSLRSNYATLVLNNTDSCTKNAAPLLAVLPNLLAKTTVVDGVATTSATDAEIFSQVTSSWTILAGGDTGS